MPRGPARGACAVRLRTGLPALPLGQTRRRVRGQAVCEGSGRVWGGAVTWAGQGGPEGAEGYNFNKHFGG